MEQKEDDTIFKRGISNHRWVSHFRSIFHDPGNQPLPKNTKLAGELDRDITDTEMKLAAYILRNGKASGFDAVSNEMLQCFLEIRPDILKKCLSPSLKTHVS